MEKVLQPQNEKAASIISEHIGGFVALPYPGSTRVFGLCYESGVYSLFCLTWKWRIGVMCVSETQHHSCAQACDLESSTGRKYSQDMVSQQITVARTMLQLCCFADAWSLAKQHWPTLCCTCRPAGCTTGCPRAVAAHSTRINHASHHAQVRAAVDRHDAHYMCCTQQSRAGFVKQKALLHVLNSLLNWQQADE